MKSKLLEFILAHPDSWEQELAAAPYCLKISYDGNLVMFKYNQLESDFSLPEVREARGIIFDSTTWTCVCRAFDKFGNYGESYVPEIDWSTVFISEKIDGSLMKVYWYDNCWMLATNGTINAFDAVTGDAKGHTFGDLFNTALHNDGQTFFTQKLDTNKCYMFELVSPYTKVVIPYESTEIYFLGSRDLTTGQEYTFAEEHEIAALFNTPRIYPMTSLKEVSEAAAALNWDEEGYVVCDANKNRCKIKSPAYVRAHYMRTSSIITLKRLISVIIENEIDEFLIYAPEWKEAIMKIILAFTYLGDTAYNYHAILQKYPFDNRKSYYDFVVNNIKNAEVRCYLMKCYDRTDYRWSDYTSNWDIHRWTRCLEGEVQL
jgi:hypothetical protein